MRESRIKTMVGLFLVISHFIVILLVIFFYFRHGFLFDEMTTTEALIVPMFAGNTTLTVSWIIATRKEQPVEDKVLSGAFTFLSFFFPVVFTVYVALVVCLKAFNVIEDLEKFKAMLGLGETFFAVYVGMFAKSLFDT
jgi:hypothetical protein